MRTSLPAARAAMLAAAGFLAIAMLLSATSSISAAPLEARWSLFGRANATSFLPGTAPSSGGYEIVSFGAVGPSAGLATYQYGGADAVPPLPAIISCTAVVGPTDLALNVNGAYPYAGCVFFVGVENTGEDPIQVNLGALDAQAQVTCNVSGCQASDLDFVAGGTTPEQADADCVATGGAVTNVGLTYTLPAGVTFTCPLFVTVLQPAKENAQYLVTVTPPAIQPQVLPTPSPSPVEEFKSPPVENRVVDPTHTPTGVSAKATPTATATATPTPPLDTVAGAKTPGGEATPLAPSTGSGVIVQHVPGYSGASPFVLICFGLALVCALFWAFPRKENATTVSPDAEDSELWRL